MSSNLIFIDDDSLLQECLCTLGHINKRLQNASFVCFKKQPKISRQNTSACIVVEMCDTNKSVEHCQNKHDTRTFFFHKERNNFTCPKSWWTSPPKKIIFHKVYSH